MPRKPRVHYKGALYHVMARGNNGEEVLERDEEKKQYLNLLKKYKERYDFKLYAYCLMDNHIHLLIEVSDIPLSKIMQGVQQSFTQIFNKKYERTGHAFQQRYKANLCDKESYFLQVIKYIHYNPVKASLDEGINYKWSSHNEYLKNDEYSLIDKDFVLSIFSNNRANAVRGYLEFINEEDDDIEEACFTIDEVPEAKHAAYRSNVRQVITIDELINEILKQENIILDELIRRNRSQKIVDIRKAIVLLSGEFCKEKNREIAQKLNISESLVSKIRSKEAKETPYLIEIMDKYKHKRENKEV